MAEAHQRLDALADTGQKRLQRPQYITEDGVGSNSARAAVTDALPVVEHDEHTGGHGKPKRRNAHRKQFFAQARIGAKLARVDGSVFVHKQAQQCGQRRKALRRYGGQRRAAHAPGEYGDEQPVQQDVAQQAENHDGHCGDGTPASAQQRVQSAVEYLQAARQHDDNGVIRRGLVQLACCAKQAEQPRV